MTWKKWNCLRLWQSCEVLRNWRRFRILWIQPVFAWNHSIYRLKLSNQRNILWTTLFGWDFCLDVFFHSDLVVLTGIHFCWECFIQPSDPRWLRKGVAEWMDGLHLILNEMYWLLVYFLQHVYPIYLIGDSVTCTLCSSNSKINFKIPRFRSCF